VAAGNRLDAAQAIYLATCLTALVERSNATAKLRPLRASAITFLFGVLFLFVGVAGAVL
jgi:hypothetical protein